MQLQAGYIIESVKTGLKHFAEENDKACELNGLFRSLSTFNVHTGLDIETPTNIPSILAVASNLITRGLPTLASIYVEEFIADVLLLTESNEQSQLGKIAFTLKNQENPSEIYRQFYSALHVIDPRERNREEYLNFSMLDSNFEKSFLLDLIPDEHAYLAQLLESQRSRGSFTRDNNRGRVDFSLEVPYDSIRRTTNKFHSEIELKHHKTYIVEVDGEAYHSDFIDDIKDFEISQLARNVSHITEHAAYEDVNNFIGRITEEEFVRVIKDNFHSDDFSENLHYSLVLSPFCIARIELVLLKYLMANYQQIVRDPILKFAVIERDFPCALIAVDNLGKLLERLNNLSQFKIVIPHFDVDVYVSAEFFSHPLHAGHNIQDIKSFKASDYAFFIDVSILRREGVFNGEAMHRNGITIRSSHYTHFETRNDVLSAPSIVYESLVKPLENEAYENIEENCQLLREILQDVFRKRDFREGQLPIMNRALQLKSVIGLLPTGGGKSLTYQLAAMLQPGVTVVIDPIRSLMIDQYNGLREIGIDKCEFINSTLTTAERNYNQNYLLANGQLQFVFVSPERFVIEDFQRVLGMAINDRHFFSYAVIDEVHCVSEWGHDFRTPYLNLGDYAQRFCKTQAGIAIPLFGLTATASFDVLADIERELNISENDGNAVVRFENTIRNEINYLVEDVSIPVLRIAQLSPLEIRKSVGAKKQKVIFEKIENMEKLFKQFNSDKSLNAIVEHSFNHYLPIATRSKILQNDETKNALQQYVSTKSEKLHLKEDSFSHEIHLGKKKYNYGLIVFTPHRQGALGIRSTPSSPGVYDNSGYVVVSEEEGIQYHSCQEERLGYFMGSGDDAEAERIDRESFEHLRLFQVNEESVMVATKAFGMGIDKPNVRMTIHINIPQSIESFVQEAGRAGRDGKLALSIILFNNQFFNINKNKDDLFNLDKDVLLYFHKNSFKGEIKERVMLHEMRNNILSPKINNLKMLLERLTETFCQFGHEFKLEVGKNNFQHQLFVKTINDEGIGNIDLNNGNTRIYNNIDDYNLCRDALNYIKQLMPFSQLNGLVQVRQWLLGNDVQGRSSLGIERVLANMKVGGTNSLLVPFNNMYYSKPQKDSNLFILNSDHLNLVFACKVIQQLINEFGFDQSEIVETLKDAVEKGLDYFEFIESLEITNTDILSQLENPDDTLSLQLHRAYVAPRSQADTAKAIYRLISIGIIDNYTIDYQNKFFKLEFTKKPDQDYYECLESLVARYTSKNIAKVTMKNFILESSQDISAGKGTVISKCMQFLTDFIYEKIKKKRLQAINDMVSLCQTSLKLEDPFEKNNYIKDEIYYYFNAKYSRRNFIEHLKHKDIYASMPDDLDNELKFDLVIKKYIYLVHQDETGEFISNIKHLRGSVMRMLRSNPDAFQFAILKAFSLFILADTIKALLNEARQEFVRGLVGWGNVDDEHFDPGKVISYFKRQLSAHIVNYNLDTTFDEIEDQFYSIYYSEWTTDFNKKILQRE